MQLKRYASAILGACLGLCAALCCAGACDPERYFAPDDADNKSPLAAPHGDFVKTQRLAARGNAVEERNLAVYYEAGYLVSRCAEKAAFWYDRAARHGDEVAKLWTKQYAAMDRLRKGPECFGNACLAGAKDGSQITSLQANARGEYAAMVTINGRTVRGVIDTGATLVSMSAKTAAELGVAYANGRTLESRTANGTMLSRAVMLDTVTVGNVTLQQVEGAVSEKDMPLLIGMSFLRRVAITTDGNAMTLEKR